MRWVLFLLCLWGFPAQAAQPLVNLDSEIAYFEDLAGFYPSDHQNRKLRRQGPIGSYFVKIEIFLAFKSFPIINRHRQQYHDRAVYILSNYHFNIAPHTSEQTAQNPLNID